jgi:hypothetical protein
VEAESAVADQADVAAALATRTGLDASRGAIVKSSTDAFTARRRGPGNSADSALEPSPAPGDPARKRRRCHIGSAEFDGGRSWLTAGIDTDVAGEPVNVTNELSSR